jgi:hypothetical protein
MRRAEAPGLFLLAVICVDWDCVVQGGACLCCVVLCCLLVCVPMTRSHGQHIMLA